MELYLQHQCTHLRFFRNIYLLKNFVEEFWTSPYEMNAGMRLLTCICVSLTIARYCCGLFLVEISYGATRRSLIQSLKCCSFCEQLWTKTYPTTELGWVLRCFFIDKGDKACADISGSPVAQALEFDARSTTVESEVELAASWKETLLSTPHFE